MMGCIRSIEPSSGSFPATRRQSLAAPFRMGAVARITVPRPVPAIPRMCLPLDPGPNDLLTALTNALNPLPGASGPRTPNSKTILSRSAPIRAAVRNRVYWTNVLTDTKVSVDIIFTGCPARFVLSKIGRRRVFAPNAIANLHPISRIKMRRRHDHLMPRY